MEATGFGVMHVDEHDRIVSFLEKPKDPPGIPGNPDMALASMGIYVFSTELPVRPAAPRRRRPELGPRFRQQHHPAPGQARQGRGAPLRAVLRQVRRRGRGLLARRRHGRRLLGGQHRPHQHRAGARPLRPATGRSGPMARSRRRPSSSTTRRAGAAMAVELAGLGRLHRLRRRPARLAAVHRRPRALLRHARRCGGPALRRHRPPCPAEQRGHRPRRADPATAWWSARTPSSTPSASAAPTRASA